MLEVYVQHGTEKKRCGYTTGSCAAAAAKASAMMLFLGKELESVVLPTPGGITLHLVPVDKEVTREYAKCGIVKDSGDDPDITNGITVFAKVSRIESGIQIKGGCGIGKVTRKGLDQPVGSDAINSTPRKMIEEILRQLMEEEEYHGGLLVELSIPQGEKKKKKTFNPRLGIAGGLSVIGTTGIIEPMSTRALVDTIRLEVNVLKEQGRSYLLVTPGNYGKTFLCEEMPEIAEESVLCSNYIGETLEIAMELGFKGVLLVGHIGKLVKLGAGIMNTHSSNADGRMEVLMACGIRAGMENAVLKKMADCVTVDEALFQVCNHPLYEALKSCLMERVEYYLQYKVKDMLQIGAVIFSHQFGVIGKTSLAEELHIKIREEIYENHGQ